MIGREGKTKQTFSIGFHIIKIILIIPQPKSETAIIPQLLIKHLSLLWCILKSFLLRERIKETPKTPLTVTEELRIPLFPIILFLGRKISSAHRDSKIRGPLEDFQFPGDGAPSLGDLNTRGARADYGAFLVLHVDVEIGPEGRMMDYAFEVIDADELGGNITLGCETSGDDEVFGLGGSTIGGLDVPATFFSVELSIDDNAVESRFFFDAEDFVAVIEIRTQVFVGWVVGGPGPVFPGFRDGELVFGNFRVNPSTGIAVPSPCPPKIIASFIDHGVESGFLQLIPAEDASKTTTYDKGVNLELENMLAGGYANMEGGKQTSSA